jgi:hypothetical protein
MDALDVEILTCEELDRIARNPHETKPVRKAAAKELVKREKLLYAPPFNGCQSTNRVSTYL